MKQTLRFLLNPRVFFNQLQWSRAHWFIFGGFALMAFIETQTGTPHAFYSVGAQWLAKFWGWNFLESIWVLTVIKLVGMTTGVYFLSHIVWHVGGLFGQQGSRRVLFRRLTVVLTVMLLGFSIRNMGAPHSNWTLLSSGLLVWACFLGFYAIQEQFNLGAFETVVVAAAVALALAFTVRVSEDVIVEVAQANGLKVPAKGMAHKPQAHDVIHYR